MTSETSVKEPSFLDSAIPVIALIIMLAAGVIFFGDNSSYGPNQIALLLSGGIAALIGIKNGYKWLDIEKAIIHGISISLGAILILLAVGALIGTWLLSGTVPTMIFYGLNFLSPTWFYAAACIICSVVSMSIGSSWTTAATIGVALLGIAKGLDLSPAITAGAIISGAYFGDKISPLSETTNLSPAVSGSELFDHIRTMLWTTVPSILIALVLFVILGFNETVLNSENTIATLNEKLSSEFNIGLFNLVPLVVLLAMAIKKVPAFPSIFIGALLGALWAVLFQQDLIIKLAADGSDVLTANITVVWTAFFDGVSVVTGDQELDSLLSGGGMSSMLNTTWLIMCALSFGAVLERLGMLRKFVNSILASVKSTGSLIATTITTCIGINLITADQYMSIVMTGRMYKEEYERRGLHPTMLSRTLEDGGTITSPLIPWNTCGAYMYSVLLVNPLEYIFFAFFNLINPLLAMIYGFIGFKVRYIMQTPANRAQAENASA
jgi:NhaC family Na+:H+ antiporter